VPLPVLLQPIVAGLQQNMAVQQFSPEERLGGYFVPKDRFKGRAMLELHQNDLLQSYIV
jgi:hypothetical protein